MPTYTQTAGGTRTGHQFRYSGTCDVCGTQNCPTIFDAAIRLGSRRTWANVCPECFHRLGGKLGTGLGQQYDRTEPTN
jgi:hypothetical protein